MAKKVKPRDLRKAKQAQKTQQFKLQEAEKKQRAEEQKREEEKQKRLKEIKNIEKELGIENIPIKSGAKAAGLKSTFVLNQETGEMLMTSFGKGNKARLDKYIREDAIVDAGEETFLKVSSNEQKKSFLVAGRKSQGAEAGNPMLSEKTPGDDLIHCRSNLETMYFGQTFKDNIHIQLIYNILDIEKVLAVQVNNIVFTINNLLRKEDADYSDLIGYMGFRDTYEGFKKKKEGLYYNLFAELIRKKQLLYFGDTFLPKDKKGIKIETANGPKWAEYEERCYYLFAVLGMLRQATAHGAKNTRADIYKMEAEYDDKDSKKCRVQARKELDALYQKRVHKLNKGFLDTSKKDLSIFFSLFNKESKEERKQLAKEYYEFVILKNYKNTGFSIKHLRETMLEMGEGADELKEKSFDTVRQKLYRAMDFTIYRMYQERPEKASELVENLRASEGEGEKEYYYRQEAKWLWQEFKDNYMAAIKKKINGEAIKSMNTEEADELTAADLEGVLVDETAHTFSEMIYFLTIFLDGKEINDLLTQLIHYFDNISSFLDVMKAENLPVEFEKEYKIFEESSQIVKELRFINSFARMSKPHVSAKKVMFLEAAQILGYSDDDLETYIDSILKKETNDQNKKDNENGFRNFIINNVIESSRFKYLVRYGNPKTLRALASNEMVIDFVLKGIPDAQIERYYNSCRTENREFFPEMRGELADIITGLHFRDFENVYQSNTDDIQKIEDKERKKNIIRLYLTVLYLLLKNLVYINSRYFLAFHCAERDAMVYDETTYKGNVLRDDRALFARDFLEKYPPKKKRVKNYLEQNMDNSDKWALVAFRNCTEHLNAIRNADQYMGDISEVTSYFALYHYLVQRSIMGQFKYDSTHKSKRKGHEDEYIISEAQVNPKLLDYFELVKKYDTYCKDFVKALNVPFAYNLPRYKNLSIKELFDRNDYKPNKGKEWEQ